MFKIPDSCLGMFRESGWFEGRHVDVVVDRLQDLNSFKLGLELLQEFGGLTVGTCGAGRDCARSDVRFLLRASVDDRYLLEGIPNAGDLFPFAWSCREYMCLYINDKGHIIACDVPAGEIHFMGDTFEVAIERLLLGYLPPPS